MRRLHFLTALVAATGCRYAPAPAPSSTPAPARPAPTPLTADEQRLRDAVRAGYDNAVALLERTVNMSSGTHNLTGVRQVGDAYGAELRALGFAVTWASVPAEMRRAGHLVAEHVPAGGATGPRLLLIGHLDTVFEGEGQRWVREDTVARGAGTSDIKGGDVAMLLALRTPCATPACSARCT